MGWMSPLSVTLARFAGFARTSCIFSAIALGMAQPDCIAGPVVR